MESILAKFAESGILGIVAAAAIWYAWRKDRECKALYEMYIRKNEDMVERYHDLSTELNGTILALTETIEEEAK